MYFLDLSRRVGACPERIRELHERVRGPFLNDVVHRIPDKCLQLVLVKVGLDFPPLLLLFVHRSSDTSARMPVRAFERGRENEKTAKQEMLPSCCGKPSARKIAPPFPDSAPRAPDSAQNMRWVRHFSTSHPSWLFIGLRASRPVSSKVLAHSRVRRTSLRSFGSSNNHGSDSKTTATLHKDSTCSTGRPLRVCVVGSGPAGFYATKYLLKASSHSSMGEDIYCADYYV